MPEWTKQPARPVRIAILLFDRFSNLCLDNCIEPLRAANTLGARTVWLDSIANVEKMRLSGRQAGWVAGLWQTQWSDLAKKSTQGVKYAGAVV